MENYCIGRINNHEIHRINCPVKPAESERIDFYAFRDSDALRKVKELYSELEICPYCMEEVYDRLLHIVA